MEHRMLGKTGIRVSAIAFDTMQVLFNALNPSAGYPIPAGSAETDYGNIIADCAAQRMGIFTIRVFAGGALVGRPPSLYTHRTPYFRLRCTNEIKEARRALPNFSVPPKA